MEFQDSHGPSKWAGTAEPYAVSFAHLCSGTIDPLLAAVGVAGTVLAAGTVAATGRKRLLDVGTGPGTLAARACERGAEVVAVDPDPGMLRLAAENAPGADVRRGAVPGLPFDDGAFDVVVANFVVNHVDDPAAAVRDLVRVTAPGGRTALTTWPVDRGALGEVWTATVTAAGLDPSVLDGPHGTDSARTPDGLLDLMREAGLGSVDAWLVGWEVRIGPEILWHGAANGVAAIGKAVTGQPPEVRARMKREYDRQVAPLLDRDELVLPTTAVLAVGERRP